MPADTDLTLREALFEPWKGRSNRASPNLKLPPFVKGFIDRRGQRRFYVSKSGLKPEPSFGEPWSPLFMGMRARVLNVEPWTTECRRFKDVPPLTVDLDDSRQWIFERAQNGGGAAMPRVAVGNVRAEGAGRQARRLCTYREGQAGGNERTEAVRSFSLRILETMNSSTDACGSFGSGSPLSHKMPTTHAATTSKKASHPTESMNQKFSRRSGCCMASSLRRLRIASL